jgi:1-phosphofructokinase family hexose kinase
MERGQEHHCAQVTLRAGGKGINVSRALMRLGVSSLATGFVGGAAGGHFKEILRLERLPFEFVDVDGETRTNLSIMEASTGQITRILESGPSIRLKDRAACKRLCARYLEKVADLVICGRQIPGGEGFYNELIRMAHRHRVRTILDTSGVSLAEGLEARPCMIKINRWEAQEICRKTLATKKEWRDVLRGFFERGISVGVMTLGEHGAVGGNGKEMWWGKVPVIKKGYTVGCGDAFLAGFLYADRRGFPLAQALCWGVAAGTAIAGPQTHPGYFSKSEVIKYAKCVKLERL